MEITEVRIKLMDRNDERLLAFASITIDDVFVVRDLKIIEGSNGVFVAMPSRRLTDRCLQCRCKNHLRARFCNQCGFRLGEYIAPCDEAGRVKFHADIAHPVCGDCRYQIEDAVIIAFSREKRLAQQPGYVCRYEDYDIDDEVPVGVGTRSFRR